MNFHASLYLISIIHFTPNTQIPGTRGSEMSRNFLKVKQLIAAEPRANPSPLCKRYARLGVCTFPWRGPPGATAQSPASVRNGASEKEMGPALVCQAHQSTRDAVWDFLLLPTHVYFSLRLISIIMRVYTKSSQGRGAKLKSTVHADGGGSYNKH